MFFSQMKAEMFKIGGKKLLIITILATLLSNGIGALYVVINRQKLAEINQWTSQYYLAIFQFSMVLILVILSAGLWYFILSSEGKYGTWSILLTKPIVKGKLLLTKHFLFILFYTLFVLVSALFSLICLPLLGVSLDIGVWAKTYLIFWVIALSISYSQIVFHLLLQNGIQAASLSIVWIFLFTLKGMFPVIISKLIPIYFLDHVWAKPIPDMKTVFIYSIATLLFVLLMIIVSIRKDYYYYD